MLFARALPVTNFVIATSALSFQVGVLYPWHKQLDDGFEELKKEHLRVLTAVESKVGQTQNPAILEESRQSVRGLLSNLIAWKA
ncbi:mitochondrial phosphate carrier protein [Fusarium austroafricanum]|uniref:Mitochondrial phosphate carrier protein n=1 Tax=Fusarium austroafricanum TaxID=2364996 RepID=A0A8H4KV44_9HYPO|nr:mitochondrial phosphate carrier protein [Fusarium austroafricanum]